MDVEFEGNKTWRHLILNTIKGTFNNYVTVRGWVGLVIFRDAA